jgi:hypothetical protein
MEAAAITGHKDLRMLKRHTHLDVSKLSAPPRAARADVAGMPFQHPSCLQHCRHSEACLPFGDACAASNLKQFHYFGASFTSKLNPLFSGRESKIIGALAHLSL